MTKVATVPRMVRVLYLTYDGVLEPLGQSQVLAYLEPLAKHHEIRLISFEKPDQLGDIDALAAMKTRLWAAGIHWTPRRYHKRPSATATAYDIAVGATLAIWTCMRHRTDVIHARSYVPALMSLGAKWISGARLLFDIRGFWADERVEGGIWPAGGRLYRMTKRLEKRFFAAADHIVTLTHASVPVLRSFEGLEGCATPITIIPTCADLDRFSPIHDPVEPPFVMGYVGSMGTWYMLEATAKVFAEVLRQRPDARFLVINRSEQEAVRRACLAEGVPEDRLSIQAVPHDQMPQTIRKMHAAAALIRPVFSKTASAPTKLAEYLGCGVPVIGNPGCGDMARILDEDRVGAVVRDLDKASIAEAVSTLIRLAQDPSIAARCQAAAVSRFALKDGVAAYDCIYGQLDLGKPA